MPKLALGIGWKARANPVGPRELLDCAELSVEYAKGEEAAR